MIFVRTRVRKTVGRGRLDGPVPGRADGPRNGPKSVPSQTPCGSREPPENAGHWTYSCEPPMRENQTHQGLEMALAAGKQTNSSVIQPQSPALTTTK